MGYKKMIEPEKKNKGMIAYTTKTKRAWFHNKSKKFGFKSTSRMILQAMEFLINTMENGISITQVQAKPSKDPIWNGWQKPSKTDSIKKANLSTPRGAVIQEIKSIFSKGNFQFVKHSDEDLNIRPVVDHRIKEEYRNIPAEDIPHAG
jgi:hypothetical protein